MGLFQNLTQVYDVLVRESNEELLPIGFSKQNIQIECGLQRQKEGRVKMVSARVIPKKDGPTILPVTKKSAIRTTNLAAHPLFDKLMYISKDYPRYMDESAIKKKDVPKRTKMFSLYEIELNNFLNSVREDVQKDVQYDARLAEDVLSTIQQYLTEENIIEDLRDKGILTVTDNKLKLSEGAEKTNLLSVLQKSEQEEALVRFLVYANREEYAVWEMKDIWMAYQSYTSKQEGLRDMCMITGEESLIAKKHPRYLRMPGDGAKLISSNDSENYTYRGRFVEANESTAISYLASEKMHSALKYLIQKNGYSRDGRVFLHFHSQGDDVPKVDFEPYHNPDGMDSESEKLKSPERIDQVGSFISGQLHRLFKGLSGVTDYQSTITTLILDAATPGRLSVLYYNEQPDNEFYQKLIQWHEKTAWENAIYIPGRGSEREGKFRFLIGAPSVWSIVEAAVGKDASDKAKKSLFQRILMSTVQGDRIPKDITRLAIQRASQPMSMSDFEWEKQLRIACSLYRNNSWNKEVYDMELDRKRTERSYLFGRLLAVVEKIEKDAMSTRNMGEGGDSRPTNAMRYMTAFSTQPYRTWNIIYKAINPYLSQLEQKNPVAASVRQKELTEIMTTFATEDDFMSNRPLEGSYLIGYYCQREDFYKKKTERTSTDDVDNVEVE